MASSEIQPQLEHQSFVEEAEYTVALVEDWEMAVAVDPLTEVLHLGKHFDADLFERWLLVEFWLGQDVVSDQQAH